MISIWLVLFSHLFSSLQPCGETIFQGLIAQDTPWDCGPAAAATLLSLNGQKSKQWSRDHGTTGTSLACLKQYLEEHNWDVERYCLGWEQIENFLLNYPNRPLLAHRHLENGHYVILLGLIKNWLVIADPSIGVRALPPESFLQDFSGYVLHFPHLSPLFTVEKVLNSAKKRLNLLKRSVS